MATIGPDISLRAGHSAGLCATSRPDPARRCSHGARRRDRCGRHNGVAAALRRRYPIGLRGSVKTALETVGESPGIECRAEPVPVEAASHQLTASRGFDALPFPQPGERREFFAWPMAPGGAAVAAVAVGVAAGLRRRHPMIVSRGCDRDKRVGHLRPRGALLTDWLRSRGGWSGLR